MDFFFEMLNKILSQIEIITIRQLAEWLVKKAKEKSAPLLDKVVGRIKETIKKSNRLTR